MNRYESAGGIFFLSVGLFFAWYARSVRVGTGAEPGPGFLPFWGGIVLAAVSAFFLARAFFKRVRTESPFFPEGDSWKRVVLTGSALVLYPLLLKPLGFTLATMLFVGVLVKTVFPQGWGKTIVTAVLAAAAARIIFVTLLGIRMPAGVLGF